MPSVEELKALIKEFRKQGVSDEEIRSTLLEMNVDAKTVEELLGVKEEKEEEVEPPEPEEVPLPPAPQEPPEEPKEVEVLPHLETAEHVKALHRKVEEIHRSLPRADELAEIRARLAQMEGELAEIRASLRAIQKLLQEILNTGRSILVDLYERSKRCG